MENKDLSQNSEPKSAELGNPIKKDEKIISKSVSDISKPAVEQIRELVFMIRHESKGKMNFKKISKFCGWSDSRVSQILGNWDNPRYVSEKSKQKIYEKLRECLESVKRGIKSEVDENGAEINQN